MAKKDIYPNRATMSSNPDLVLDDNFRDENKKNMSEYKTEVSKEIATMASLRTENEQEKRNDKSQKKKKNKK